MVPVELELQNFLSYGTEAPALDFSQFDVACLSGGNGEGKSALLDAITWALWGEARKSSGKRKPDDELIRIGSRHMEVSFTFDLEDSRYRVTRSFSRSATGKTTSSDLEFQLHDPETEEYRPLTGSTQRETQSKIEETVGLDYDTFINSAFLLQGRSDEFTNKSPSQRKDILVRILNLRRYEALEDKARDRWRQAKQRQQRLEAETKRLKEAIADVPEWEERRADLQETLEERQERVQVLRDKEKSLTQEKANLEAKAREVESVQASIEDLDSRIEEKEDQVEEMDRRISEADDLLGRKERITQRYERYQELQEQRDDLDEKRDLHRGLEKQRDQLKATLQQRRNELERRLDRLSVERDSFEKDLKDFESKISKREDVEEKLRSAMAARQQVSEMARVRSRREDLKAQQDEARRSIVSVRKQLLAQRDTMKERVDEEQEAVATVDDLSDRIEALEERAQERDRLQKRIEAVEQKGKALSQKIQEHAGHLEARKEERSREEAELERLRSAEGPTCPTCGTELTPSHRNDVVETLRSSINELDDALESHRDTVRGLKEERADLRKQYSDLREKIEELDGVQEELATTREKYRSITERAEAIDGYKEKIDQIEQRLESGKYAEAERRRWQWSAQRLAELQFEERRFDRLRNQAAQVERYTERLRELDELEGRRTELERKISEHEEEIASIRTALDEGGAFEELQEKIQTVEQQLEAVDFDPERFQAVREELEELSDVQDRMSDLRNAKKNREEWTEKKEEARDRLNQLREERSENRDRVETMQKELEKKSSVEEQLDELDEDLRQAEAAVNEAQQSLGKLNERLEQAERDQERLEETKDELESSKENRTLYKRLRTAFGKHGIPSLIIEETLPEIEERANRILDRLTDGRMHIQLETLKEKKSGGTKETLEIIITDEQGVARPYETFSGGESFRVNFALRVALSQLLADRSGIRVRTLVIDEGFGTQDEHGIQRLVDAIQAIRQDFAKILVITHLQRLKEAFPVRIEVEKDPALGSTFEVVGV